MSKIINILHLSESEKKIQWPKDILDIIKNTKRCYIDKSNAKKWEDNFNFKMNWLSIKDYIEVADEGLERIFEISLNLANNLSKIEPLNLKTDSKERIIGTIKQALNKFDFSAKEGDSMFVLFSDIFFKIIKFHHLHNGNKRMALSCLWTLMWWPSRFWFKPLERWELIDEQLVKFASSKEKDEIIKKEIKDFIIKNTVIYLK